MRVGARLQRCDGDRATRVWIEHGSLRHADDEVRSQVMNPVRAHNPVLGELILNTQVELLHHGILQVVIDDVDALGRASCSRNDDTSEGTRKSWGAGNEMPIRVQIVGAAQAYVDGQGPAVESTLQ